MSIKSLESCPKITDPIIQEEDLPLATIADLEKLKNEILESDRSTPSDKDRAKGLYTCAEKNYSQKGLILGELLEIAGRND